MKKKIIDWCPYWECENLDTLAPITKKGIEVLFNDNTTEYFDEFEDITKYYEHVTEEEFNEFRLKCGKLKKGDQVKIIKGKTLPIGEVKTIQKFFTFEVKGTYGHRSTRYVSFTDGSKINIRNIQPNVEMFEDAYISEFNGFNIGGRK